MSKRAADIIQEEEEDEFEEDYVIPQARVVGLERTLGNQMMMTAAVAADCTTTTTTTVTATHATAETESRQQQHCQKHQQKQAAAPAFPETASTPITSHFDSVLECLDFIRSAEDDPQIDKQEVIETIRGRLHNMVSKILLGNTITSMSMMGWRLE